MKLRFWGGIGRGDMYLLIMLGLCLRRRQMTSVNMQSFSQLALLVVKVFLGSTTTPYWSTLWTRKRIIWRWTHRNLSSSTPLSYGLFMCAIQRLNGLRWSKSEVLTCMKHDIKTQEERGENETLSCYHRVKLLNLKVSQTNLYLRKHVMSARLSNQQGS